VSWKGRRGALARGGARGGDGRAEGWSEEAALSGQGCDGRHWHSARRKKGCSTGGGGLLLLKVARGGGRRRRGGGNQWAGKRRQQSHGCGQGSSGGRCLKAVGTVRTWSAHGSDRETDTRGPHGFFIIPESSKLAQL
jgi:hypothetical protein